MDNGWQFLKWMFENAWRGVGAIICLYLILQTLLRLSGMVIAVIAYKAKGEGALDGLMAVSGVPTNGTEQQSCSKETTR